MNLKTQAELQRMDGTGPIRFFWCGAYDDPLSNCVSIIYPFKKTPEEQLAAIQAMTDVVPILVENLPFTRENREHWILHNGKVIDPFTTETL